MAGTGLAALAILSVLIALPVGANAANAQWSAQWAGNTESLTLEAGETGRAYVRARNTGSETWHRGAVKLGTVGEYPPDGQDRSSEFADMTWLNPNRPATLTEPSVSPNEVGSFTFNLRAPQTASTVTRREYFAPLAEGIEWMYACPAWCRVHVPVTVVPAASPTVELFVSPASVEQGVQILADASANDNHAVDRVVFRLADRVVTATAPPYRATFDTSELGVGSHIVSARVFDRAGLQATDARSFTVRSGASSGPRDEPATVVPEPGKVTINEGARFTNRRLVRVTATPPSGAETLTLSNDGGFNPSATFPLTGGIQTFSWLLDDNEADRDTFLVFARFGGGAGITSAQDSIVLDQRRPRIDNGRATLVRASDGRPALRLSLRARDVGSGARSGVSAISVQVPGTRVPRVLDYRRVSRISLPRRRAQLRSIAVRVRDLAGNFSKRKLMRVR
jgi:hypothetical protein